MAIQLSDGTIMNLEATVGGGYKKGDKTANASYSAFFEVPIDLNDVEALIICGSSFTIDLNN